MPTNRSDQLDRREFFQSAAAMLPLGQQEGSGARRPNILFILADQWRAQTLPSSGDPDLHAPNLQRLAREGVHFDRAYVSYPLCCPSRCSIATGRFPQTYGMVDNRPILPLAEKCMAQELKKIGYRTGYIGKWHLDGNPGPNFVPPGERRRGFDYWAAFSRGHRYYDSVYYRDIDQPIPMTGFEPDYQTDLAVDFIKSNRDKPFYLFVSWGPPHEMAKPGHPRGAPPRYSHFYKPEQFHLPPNVPREKEVEARRERVDYYGACSGLDDCVGRLLDTLDQTGLAEDTIVVFCADHGDMLFSQGLLYKMKPYEESARTPLLFRYPRRVKGGRKEDLMISNVDYMPTLLAFCGAAAPNEVQGRELSRQIIGGKNNRPESILCVCELGNPREWRMVVQGKDKLVVDVLRRPTHLFDLASDPYEMHNLVNDPAHARKKLELEERMREWILRVG